MRNTVVSLAAIGVLLVGWPPGVPADALGPRHLIYLHGRIVQEQQSERPRHPQFGHYEVAKILDAFRDRGFVVSGEIRPKSASMSESATRVPLPASPGVGESRRGMDGCPLASYILNSVQSWRSLGVISNDAPNPRLQRTQLRQGYGGQARAERSPLSCQPLGVKRIIH